MDVRKRIVTFQITLLPLNKEPQTDVNRNFTIDSNIEYKFYYCFVRIKEGNEMLLPRHGRDNRAMDGESICVLCF